MLRFQKNKSFRVIALFLFICLSAVAFHFLVHAAHPNNDRVDADHCVICQFVTTAGTALFCIFLLFLKLQQTRPRFLEVKNFLPFKYLSAASSRAPPFLLS